MVCSERGGSGLRAGHGGLFEFLTGTGWKSLSLIGCALGDCRDLLSEKRLVLGKKFFGNCVDELLL